MRVRRGGGGGRRGRLESSQKEGHQAGSTLPRKLKLLLIATPTRPEMLLLSAAVSAVSLHFPRSAVSYRRLSPPQLSAAPKSDEFATFRAAEDRLRQIHATSPRRSAEPQSSAAALPNDEFRDFREAEARLRRIHWHNFRAAEARLRRLAIPRNDEWRDFRARLIAGAVGAAPAVSTPTTPNAAKLRQQDEALFDEPRAQRARPVARRVGALVACARTPPAPRQSVGIHSPAATGQVDSLFMQNYPVDYRRTYRTTFDSITTTTICLILSLAL